jgi:hypothetical protein
VIPNEHIHKTDNPQWCVAWQPRDNWQLLYRTEFFDNKMDAENFLNRMAHNNEWIYEILCPHDMDIRYNLYNDNSEYIVMPFFNIPMQD